MEITMPYVSVIIPAFNQKQNIASLVNSLLTQTYPRDKLEIIIVDWIIVKLMK